MIEERIQSRLETLSKRERQLAELLLAFPGEVATNSATELAERAKVSKATATRLFRRLGYRDYNEARREARAARRSGLMPYLNVPTGIATNLSRQLSLHLDREVINLTRSIEALNPETVAAVVDGLVKARRVVIIGFRSSYILGDYLRRQLATVRTGVELLPRPGQTLGDELSGLAPEDMIVIVAFRRRVPVIREIFKLTGELAIQTLLFTDSATKLDHAVATWTISCPVYGAYLFDSYVGPLSAMSYLCSAVAQHEGDVAQARFRRSERLHKSLRELEI